MPEMIMNRNLLLYGMAALGAAGALGMLTTHLTYRRMLRNTKDDKKGLKEKWTEIWKTRDRLLARMNRFVWYPALISTLFLGIALVLNSKLQNAEGLSFTYVYLGTAIPVILLLLRQGLDFTYREELMIRSLKDHVEQVKGQGRRTEAEPENMTDPKVVSRSAIGGQDPDDDLENALQREAVIDHIAESIRQTAAAGSHFRNMLTAEEEEIMREVIKEFMS
ncbi:MAG: hypothetical protein IJW67_01420 [Blautia sp.]|nr:hypothetical protein [Blautia sp.]